MVNDPPMQTDQSIVALLADVDGTLVTKEKVLTERLKPSNAFANAGSYFALRAAVRPAACACLSSLRN